jgi:hypothetical protein
VIIRVAAIGGVAVLGIAVVAFVRHGSTPADASPRSQTTSDPSSTSQVSGPSLTASASSPSDETAPSRAPLPAGRDTLVLGDSLGLDVYPWLADLLPDRYVSYDAVVGRATPATLLALRTRADVPPVVLVSLGTNDLDPASFRTAAEGILATLGPDRCVVWSDVVRPDSFGGGSAPINTVIDDLARTHSNVRIFRWSALVAEHPEWLSGDGIHPGQDGAHARAQGFADAALACSPLDASAPVASKQYLAPATFDAPGGSPGRTKTQSSPSRTPSATSSRITSTASPTASASTTRAKSGQPSTSGSATPSPPASQPAPPPSAPTPSPSPT